MTTKIKKNGAYGRTKMLSALTENPLVRAVVESKEGTAERNEAMETLQAAIRTGEAGIGASTLYQPEIIIPGTPMDAWMAAWAKHSIAPAELVFWIPFQWLGHLIAKRGGKIRLAAEGKAMSECWPELYMLHAADPGRGKGAITGVTREALGLKHLDDGSITDELGQCGSRESFLKALGARDGKAAMQSIDEFAFWWKKLRADPVSSEMVKDYLCAFTQERLSLEYTKHTYIVKKPILGLQLLVQPDTLATTLSSDDFACGMIRRLLIIWSPPRPTDRSDVHKYVWPKAAERVRKEGVMERWQQCLAETPIHQDYTLSESAYSYIEYHNFNAGMDAGLGNEFLGTYFAHCMKFALIFHVLHGCKGTVIETREAKCAVALAKVAMSHLQYLLEHATRSKLSKWICKAIEIKKGVSEGRLKGAWYPRDVGARKLVDNIAEIDAPLSRFLWDIATAARDGVAVTSKPMVYAPVAEASNVVDFDPSRENMEVDEAMHHEQLERDRVSASMR